MFLDMVNIEKVRRAIVYFGVMLLVLLVQNDILSNFAVFGVHALIAPIAVVAVGFFEGGVWGGGGNGWSSALGLGRGPRTNTGGSGARRAASRGERQKTTTFAPTGVLR